VTQEKEKRGGKGIATAEKKNGFKRPRGAEALVLWRSGDAGSLSPSMVGEKVPFIGSRFLVQRGGENCATPDAGRGKKIKKGKASTQKEKE